MVQFAIAVVIVWAYEPVLIYEVSLGNTKLTVKGEYTFAATGFCTPYTFNPKLSKI
jgi:hypothetical protein